MSYPDKLSEEGIRHDPQQMSVERLRREAWAIMESRFKTEVERLKDQFMTAKAHQRGSDELVQVAAAAVGRVDTLLVDGSREIPGWIDQQSGELASVEAGDPRADDVLDDLAEMVLRRDGAVLVLPPEMMPGDAGLAAIYRY